MSNNKHVVVIGAGVTGLTSALFLSDAGYKVTIIGAHVPGDLSIEYTSPWAGAHWMSHAMAHETMQCDWDKQTYAYMCDIIEKEAADLTLPKSGLKHNRGYGFHADPIPHGRLWWSPYVKEYQQLASTDSPVADINAKASNDVKPIEHAFAYTSISINSPQYLLYLQAKCKRQGVIVIKALLPTDNGLEKALNAAKQLARSPSCGKVDAFVNATGLGALKLCDDKAMYPIRGQTVLVKGEAAAERTRSGPSVVAYCIPRPGSGTTILGGTRDDDVWDEAPTPSITKRILEHNSWQAPELLTGPNGGFEVISEQVGLRPGRRGGPRMEKEVVDGSKVVHAYGHAGAGYQNSIGSARLVVKLVHESLNDGSPSKL